MTPEFINDFYNRAITKKALIPIRFLDSDLYQKIHCNDGTYICIMRRIRPTTSFYIKIQNLKGKCKHTDELNDA